MTRRRLLPPAIADAIVLSLVAFGAIQCFNWVLVHFGQLEPVNFSARIGMSALLFAVLVDERVRRRVR